MILVLEMSEVSALARAKDNDSEAIEFIFNKYKPLVNHMANKYYMNNGGDKDDIIQIANIALWDAIKAYDGKRDFSTLAKTIVNRAMIYNLKKNTTQKADINNITSSLDDTVNDGDTSLYDLIASNDVSPEDSAVSQDSINRLRDYIENELSDMESKVIALTIKGYKTQDIADILDVNYKSVNNSLSRARAKVRNFVLTQLESKNVDLLLKIVLS